MKRENLKQRNNVIHLKVVVDLLHRLAMRDQLTMRKLIEDRREIDPSVMSEPGLKPYSEGGLSRVGMLEIINAMFGGNGEEDGPIVPVYSLACIDCLAHSGSEGKTPARCPECGGTIVRSRIVTFAITGR